MRLCVWERENKKGRDTNIMQIIIIQFFVCFKYIAEWKCIRHLIYLLHIQKRNNIWSSSHSSSSSMIYFLFLISKIFFYFCDLSLMKNGVLILLKDTSFSKIRQAPWSRFTTAHTMYSNLANVMHYLVRLEPFTTLHIQLQVHIWSFCLY